MVELGRVGKVDDLTVSCFAKLLEQGIIFRQILHNRVGGGGGGRACVRV